MRLLTTAAVGITLAAGPAFAHHPFASEFDAAQPVHLTGRVTQVSWNNPHVIFRLTAASPGGNQNWSMEAAAPGDLQQKGGRATL
jgi:Family of unknown function (DUF6152)